MALRKRGGKDNMKKKKFPIKLIKINIKKKKKKKKKALNLRNISN